MATGDVRPEAGDRPSDDLIDPEPLTQEHDARGDADEGDEVLVDEHLVGAEERSPLCQAKNPNAATKTVE